MRAVALAALGALCLVGVMACGAPARPDRGPAGAQIADTAARGLPTAGGRPILILAADGVDDLSLFGAWYALVATGWSARIATPARTGTVTADGRAVLSSLTFDAVKAADHPVVFVPAGLPADPAIDRIISGAAHLVVAAGAGERVRAAGITAPLADDDAMVRIEGNVISAARTGDLPHLVWTLEAYAEDRLRPADAAATRQTPP